MLERKRTFELARYTACVARRRHRFQGSGSQVYTAATPKHTDESEIKQVSLDKTAMRMTALA